MQAFKEQKNLFSIILVFVTLSIIGIAMLPLVNIQLSPSLSLPSITVNYNWPNASAHIVEKEVTSKLEGVLSSVSGIKDISSTSYKGSGVIQLFFKKNADIDICRFEVSTLIRRVYPDLPEQVSYPTLSIGSNNNTKITILTYTLSGNTSPFYIQQYANENIVPKLSSIHGISETEVYGATQYEWAIEINSLLMNQLNISVNEIKTGISDYFREDVIGMGIEGSDSVDKVCRLILSNNRADALNWNTIPIKSTKNRIVYLNDIAKIKYQEQLPNSYYRINGLNTINLVIYAEQGINTIKVANAAKEYLNNIKKTLPPGYYINMSYDSTEYLNKELTKVGLRSLYSLLILMLFVLLISRHFKYLLLITVSLLANLLIAIIFYYLLHVEIHLYSLAGITVSMGIIIDNSIVMIDHYRYHKNKKVFIAILAATLTTIGALSVIFFLKDEDRLNLIDFVVVMIINLFVSLAVAWYFIPALFEKIRFQNKTGKRFIRRKRSVIRFNIVYRKIIIFSKRFKWVLFVITILGFGLPLHLLPKKIEKDNAWASFYNKTIGNEYFTNNIRPKAEIVLGGSLRLFSEYVFESSYYSEPVQTKLYIRGKMPEGCTVQQLNSAIEKMENYISQFSEIDMFETSIWDYRNSSITITFKPEFEQGSFPYKLKGLTTQKAISLGGLDWSIYGVGQGFSNEIGNGYKSNQILIEGYNYNQLYGFASQLSAKLLLNARVREPEITGRVDWGGNLMHELYFDFNPQLFALNNISMGEFYKTLEEKVFSSNVPPVFDGKIVSPVTLYSNRANDFHTWWLMNEPLLLGKKMIKVSDLGKVSRQNTGNDIYKFNQQYQLIVAYDFIGPNQLAEKVTAKAIAEINPTLPVGYKASINNFWGWNKRDKQQYYLLFIVIVIIYFICSILLESLIQALAILALIPISFIGVFLTFYLFDFNFDQGGIASFILLCGIVVNSGLYIINDFNIFAKSNKSKNLLWVYVKAFNHKIIPVFLTVTSTIIGLIPFVWGGQHEVFWFSFAVGTIGGLTFSIIALIIYFPLFIKMPLSNE